MTNLPDPPIPVTLLPCPFCGGKATLVNRTPWGTPPFTVECRECSFDIWPHDTERAAIDFWNTRTQPTPDTSLLETLAKIEKAQEMVSALCKPRGSEGARAWSMSIPARPDYDPDLVIADALRAAKDAIARAHPTPDRDGLMEIRDGLDVLSKLGNGARDGNSTGNDIAQRLRAKLDTIMGDASTRKDEEEAQNGQLQTNGDQPALIRPTSPVSPSEIPLVDKPDTLIMACQEVLRLMDKWRTWHAYSETCECAVAELRSEMQKHLRTREPVMVSLEKCALAYCQADEAFDMNTYSDTKPHPRGIEMAKAVLDAAGVPYVE